MADSERLSNVVKTLLLFSDRAVEIDFEPGAAADRAVLVLRVEASEAELVQAARRVDDALEFSGGLVEAVLYTGSRGEA